MKLKLKNAEDMLKEIQRDNRYQYTYDKNKVEYQNALTRLADQEVEVETKYLFDDQYNTPPLDGVSENGLRIMERYVEAIIDDVRPGMVKCRWCGNNYNDTGSYCHSVNYIERF